LHLQFNGGKGFVLGASVARECHSHCSVSNVTKNAAVQRTHRIGVLWSGIQHNRSSSISNLFRLESNQAGHGYIVRLRPSPKV